MTLLLKSDAPGGSRIVHRIDGRWHLWLPDNAVNNPISIRQQIPMQL